MPFRNTVCGGTWPSALPSLQPVALPPGCVCPPQGRAGGTPEPVSPPPSLAFRRQGPLSVPIPCPRWAWNSLVLVLLWLNPHLGF